MKFNRSLLRGRRHRLADQRTVLIPNQWNGSVQQYFHFLLGYLAPVAKWTAQHPGQPIAVRDCGPMNRWFELVQPETDIEIMTVGDVLHVLAGELQPNQVLRGMDYPDKFSATDLGDFASWSRSVAARRSVAPAECPPIVVSNRASSDEFFATPAAEWPESGSQKRSVPNLPEICASIDDGDLRILDAAKVGIYEQIVLHSHAKILVGQHGAGLTNMIWMPAGAYVIEILPPMPAEARNIFEHLASTLGLHYSLVDQDSVHSPVDANSLRQAIHRAKNSIAYKSKGPSNK